MKNKVITMFLLASMICSSSAVTTFAADGTDGKADPVVYQTGNNDGAYNCKLHAEITDDSNSGSDDKNNTGGNTDNDNADIGDSKFKLTLPKLINIDSKTKSATYKVTCSGSIADESVVHVVPDATAVMTKNGSDDTATATITQQKQKFRSEKYADSLSDDEAVINASIEGSVNVPELTKGTWDGSFNFNVNTDAVKDDSSKDDSTKDNTATQLAPGLYDENDKMVVSWDDSGINVEHGFTNDDYKHDETSPYNVLKQYPTARKVVIPDGTTKIVDMAFYDCSNLTSVVIPNSVVRIGKYAFSHCGLNSINIPDTITEIKDYTFYDCKNLKSVNMSKSITSIGAYAFYNCSSLSSIDIPNGVTIINKNTFCKCASLKNINIPNTVKKFDTSCFQECINLETIDVPDSVTNFMPDCFMGCSSLKSITFPSGLRNLDYMAFYKCSSLTSVIYNDTTYTHYTPLCKALEANKCNVYEISNDYTTYYGGAVFTDSGMPF